RDDSLQRDRSGRQQIKAAILVIQRENPIQRQQAGQQCAHPKDSRRNRTQRLAAGTDSKRHKRAQDQEERNRKTETASGTGSKDEIAFQKSQHQRLVPSRAYGSTQPT